MSRSHSQARAAGRGTNTGTKAGGVQAWELSSERLLGGTGAGIGALSGGVLGGGSNGLSRGKEIDIKPEQLLQFRTSAPLDRSVV